VAHEGACGVVQQAGNPHRRPKGAESFVVAFGPPKPFLVLTREVLSVEKQRGLGRFGRVRGCLTGRMRPEDGLSIRPPKHGLMWGAA